MVVGKDKMRLLIVRETMDEARSIVSGNPTDYSLMKAVWLADLAVELTLASVMADLELHLETTRPMFHDYVKAIVKDAKHQELTTLKLHKAELGALHDARNRVHNGLAFTQEGSKRLVQKAELFVQTAFQEVYGVDLDKLSVISFLNPGEARDRLVSAESKIADGDYDGAAIDIAVAFEVGKRDFGNRPSQGNTHVYRRRLIKVSNNLSEHLDKDLAKSVSAISSLLYLLRYGVDLDKAMEFLETSKAVAQAFGNPGWMTFDSPGEEFTESNTRSHLEFVADVLYRFQVYAERH